MRVTLSRCGWLLLLFGVVAPVQATDTRFDAVDASVDALVAEHHLGGAVSCNVQSATSRPSTALRWNCCVAAHWRWSASRVVARPRSARQSCN